MKIFICYREIDQLEGLLEIKSLLKESENIIAILTETEHSQNWKENVTNKMTESDFVLFLIGKETFKSEQMIWEYAEAKNLNKRLIGIKLKNASEDSILYCQGFQVFENSKQAFKFILKAFEYDRQLKIEQYKIMVSSTEKVTDQRLKVNNLFFTITSSILSISFVLGKTFNFNFFSLLVITILSFLALIVTFFWEKLVNSYGLLNRGKFVMISQIEKSLRTNMFEDEWKILTQDIKYKPNTQTETKIVERFRAFIIVVLVGELFYLFYSLYIS